jgi:hypothetical protein
LAVEQLEDRMLPSTFYAATVSDLIADIRAANTGGGLNSIVLTAPTTSPYVLTAANNSTDGPTGLPVIAASNNLTIVGNGDTIERSTAAGTPYFRLLDVASGGSLTVQNLTVQNGMEVGPYARGGGVFNQGSLILSAVTVQNNRAEGGGDAAGGGIFSSGTLTLQNGTLIQSNYAFGGNAWIGPDGGGWAYGGGVYVAGGTANLTGVTLSKNVAAGGRGGDGDLNPPDLVGIWPPESIGGNGGSAFGGGLFVNGGTVNLSGSTVSGNWAFGGDGGKGTTYLYTASGGDAYGAGIYIAGGTVSLSNDTVQSNAAQGGFDPWGSRAGGYGGGLYIQYLATVYLDSFTVAHIINNTADFGPNIWGSYTLRN